MKRPKLPNPASVLDAKYTAEQMRAYATKATLLEREACAKVCDWMQEKAEFHGTDCCKFPTPTDCAHVIRARGEA